MVLFGHMEWKDPRFGKAERGGCVVRVSNEFFLSPTVLLESLTTLSGGSGSTVDTCDYCGAGSSQGGSTTSYSWDA